MFFQFTALPYEIPLVVWNHCYLQPAESFQSTNTETMIKINENCQKDDLSQNSQKVVGLTKEKILHLIAEKLQTLHKQNSASKKTHWSEFQDELLEKLVEKQRLQWKEIPKYLSGRTLSMCYSRYRRILMNTKQGWKKQDDELIIKLVQNKGEKWKQISNEFPKFTPKQIRQRYLNYLRPNIDKSEFTFEEDFKICQLVMQHGKHWRKFEEELPGRTQGAIKSRFYSKLKDIIEQK